MSSEVELESNQILDFTESDDRAAVICGGVEHEFPASIRGCYQAVILANSYRMTHGLVSVYIPDSWPKHLLSIVKSGLF